MAWGRLFPYGGAIARRPRRRPPYVARMSIPFVATPSWQHGPSDWGPPSSELPPPPVSGRSSRPSAAATAAATSRGDESGTAAPDLAALGPLAGYAASGPVTDLFVNGSSGLWIDRGAGPEPEPSWSADEAEVRALAVRLIARGGRHIDEATPAVDVRLGRGIRVHVMLREPLDQALPAPSRRSASPPHSGGLEAERGAHRMEHVDVVNACAAEVLLGIDRQSLCWVARCDSFATPTAA